MLATSGIDDEIRLWEPLGQDVEVNLYFFLKNPTFVLQDERRVTNIWDRLHTEDVSGARVGLQAVVSHNSFRKKKFNFIKSTLFNGKTRKNEN